MPENYVADIRIAYNSPEHATMIKDCLDVDSELQPDRVNKDVTIEGSYVIV